MYDIRGMVEQLKLCDVEFEKNKFHCFKKAINIGRCKKSIGIWDFGQSKNKQMKKTAETAKKTGPLLITLPQRIDHSNKVEQDLVHIFCNQRWKIVGKI